MNVILMLRYPVAMFTLLVVGTGAINCFAQTVDLSLVSTTVQEDATNQPDASQLGSLMRVPDSTGFYFSTMNHQAIVEAIFESNAYKSVKASDVSRGMKKAYRRGRTRGYDDYNRRNPFAQYLQGYGDSVDNVIFQSVWQIAKQVIDNELFLYVDNDALPIATAINDVQAKMLESFNLGTELDFDQLSDEQKGELIEMFAETIKSIECPTIILGSRLENPQGFRGMLELARSGAEQAMRSMPAELDFVQEFWNVVEEDDNFLLAAEFELSKLPWDEILEDSDEDAKELVTALLDAVGKKRATVAMGIVDNLLVFGVAEDRTRLTEFGNGAKMIDLDSLKPLRAAIDQNQKVTSVFYMSQEYANASYSMEQFYQQLKPSIQILVNLNDDISETEKERWVNLIETEANEFITDFKPLFPSSAMTFSFTTMQKDGLHGYARSNAKHPMLDGSKPLKLATHTGPNTIAFLNQRLYRVADQYELMSKWTSKLYHYGRDLALEGLQNTMLQDDALRAEKPAPLTVEPAAEDLALEEFNRELSDGQPNKSAKQIAKSAANQDKSKMQKEDGLDNSGDDISNSQPDIETIKSFVSDVEGLVQRFDDVTRKKLLPAIDGQEAGLFLDAVSGPNPWHPAIPESKSPLPLPFPSMVVGNNNSQAVVEAGEEYWKLADELLTSAKKHFPEEEVVEAFLLPPNRIEKNGQVSFRWSFLHDFGQVDSSVQPGCLIGENWMVMNMHPDQAKRLTTPQEGQQLFGPADTDEASISVAFYDHRVMMKSLRTWIDFVETQIPADESPFNLAESFPAERDTLQFTEPQLRDAFERVWAFAGCMKGVSIRSYEDETGTVTESLMKFKDIE